MKKIKQIFFLLFFTWTYSSCEKEITLDLPETEIRLVIEGRIEQDFPPIIIITRSIGYFDLTSFSSLDSLFVHNAEVKIEVGSAVIKLREICSSAIPDSLKPLVSELSGIQLKDLKSFDYCIYSTDDIAAWGRIGKTYNLHVAAEGKTYVASTGLLAPVPLDSLWFKTEIAGDSLGFVWATLSEPIGAGNYYRWMTKRLGKDFGFVAPLGSVFDDKFINGKTFNFAYNRGRLPNSDSPDDYNRERGYFKTNDTVVVKFCSIDRGVYDFVRTFEDDVANNGNPFSAPGSVKSNIKGGALGYFGAYGVVYDTLIAMPK